MKNIFILIALVLASSAYGATCTSTTRNNYVTNQVLTSTALNADFNQLVTKANDFDGGCVTDGTLESDALNTTQFAPLLKAVKEGCLVTRSDANTISVDKCLIAISGTLIEKTTATTATWGCSGCSAEANSTTYYVYATATSPLTLQILTTAPDAYGYSGTSRVLGSFYNDASGNIAIGSIANWDTNGFSIGSAINVVSAPGMNRPKDCIYFFGQSGSTLASPVECTSGTCGEVYDSCEAGSPPTWATIALYQNMTFASGTWAASSPLDCKCEAYDANAIEAKQCVLYRDTSDDSWSTNASGGAVLNMVTNNPTPAQSTGYVKVTCRGTAP